MEAKPGSRSPGRGRKGEDYEEDQEDELFLGESNESGRKEEQQKHGKIAAAHGLALDLNNSPYDTASSSNNEHRSQEEKILNRLETQVLVIFELPDGSTGEEEFKLGHTVDFLKSYVEREFSIPMAEQQLYYEGRLMLDPLSLVDYTHDTENPMVVRVEGDMEDVAKK